MIYQYKEQIVDTPLAKELYDKLMPLLEGEEHVLALMGICTQIKKSKK